MPEPADLVQFLAAAAALYYLAFWLQKPESIARSVTKTLPVALLAIAVLIGGASPVLAAALAFSAAGDWFLSREGERDFLSGLGAFLTAHLLYIALFAGAADPAAFMTRNTGLTAIILAALSVLVLMRLWPYLDKLRIPVIVYAATISAMAVAARVAMPGIIVLAGVALFIVSDTILAHDRFTPLSSTLLRRRLPALVMITYYAAQLLIVYGLLHA